MTDAHFLKISGVIKDKDNLEFFEEGFLKLLADYGYTFSGETEAFHNQQLLEDIQYIADRVDENILKRMLVQHRNIFGSDSTYEQLKYTLTGASGSAAFSSITLNALPEDCVDLVKKYNGLDYTIFDIFNEQLGEVLSKKIV